MRMKYSRFEQAFEHIWNNADPDGLWDGDAASMATEFRVTEDEAHGVLGEICDSHFIERVGTATYIITRWPERDDLGDEVQYEIYSPVCRNRSSLTFASRRTSSSESPAASCSLPASHMPRGCSSNAFRSYTW
jgi:hypothetical protein